MRHLKTYESWFSKTKIGKRISHFVNPPKPKPFSYKISDEEVFEIKDIFQDMVDDYGLEEDPNGTLKGYITLPGVNRKERPNPQFFTERNSSSVLTFAVASSKNFLNDKFIEDLQDFKSRLERAGFKCSLNDIYLQTWIKYVAFYITKQETPARFTNPSCLHLNL